MTVSLEVFPKQAVTGSAAVTGAGEAAKILHTRYLLSDDSRGHGRFRDLQTAADEPPGTIAATVL